MSSPNIGNTVDGWTWAADNGCFSDNWNADKWRRWLESTSGAIFATAPDVVADAAATRQRWDEWHDVVTGTGHAPAYVIQDGQDDVDVPWGDMAAIFVGGSTAYKLSESARRHVAEAKRRGLWAHMGRVNSFNRLRLADDWGCDSADGTFLAFGPDANTPRLIRWLHRLNSEPRLEFA
jgi:hypothetical protein